MGEPAQKSALVRPLLKQESPTTATGLLLCEGVPGETSVYEIGDPRERGGIIGKSNRSPSGRDETSGSAKGTIGSHVRDLFILVGAGMPTGAPHLSTRIYSRGYRQGDGERALSDQSRSGGPPILTRSWKAGKRIE